MKAQDITTREALKEWLERNIIIVGTEKDADLCFQVARELQLPHKRSTDSERFNSFFFQHKGEWKLIPVEQVSNIFAPVPVSDLEAIWQRVVEAEQREDAQARNDVFGMNTTPLPKQIDWQKVRIQIARDIYRDYLKAYIDFPLQDRAELSRRATSEADALIAELRKEKL